jgi:osmotically-inducible protein OsmY
MRAVAALALLLAAPACAPVVTPFGLALTAGATGGTMAMQERGLGGAIEDNAIVVAINEAWLREDPAIFRKVSTAIHDGIVVLTGHVTYPETASRAEAIAARIDGVREVVNHIRIDRSPDLATAAQDRWITTRLRAALTFAPEVNAVNYSIDTVAGTVYVSGIARDQAELDRVLARVRATGGVKDVVSAVRLRTEPLPMRNGQALAAAQIGPPVPVSGRGTVLASAPPTAPLAAAPSAASAPMPASPPRAGTAAVTREALPPP